MYLHRYLISFTAQEELQLHGYPQNILRAAMHQAISMTDPELYRFLTEPEVSSDLILSGKIHNTPPAPYVLSQVYRDFQFQKGDKLNFILTVFGRIYEFEESFLRAFKKCCSIAGDPSISKFEFSGYEKLYCPVSGNAEFVLKDYVNLDPGTDHLIIRFTTPVNLKHNSEKAISDFSFARIYNKYLISRISNLSRIYCQDDIDLKEIKSETIKTVSIEATRRQVRGVNYKSEGWLGRIIYQGDFNDIYGILKFGEFIHIGSDTHKGLGAYKVEFII